MIAGASAAGSANCAVLQSRDGSRPDGGRRASYFFGLTLFLRLIAVLGSALSVSRAFFTSLHVGGSLSAFLAFAPLAGALRVFLAFAAVLHVGCQLSCDSLCRVLSIEQVPT